MYVDAPGKMRNHLAINVLNWDMLNLMKTYQSSLEDLSELDGIVLLLCRHVFQLQFYDIICARS